MAEQDIAELLGQNVPVLASDYADLEKGEIHDFIDHQKKKNTVISTKRDVKKVYEYMVNKRAELRNLENIPPNELDIHLSKFYMEIRKRDGADYEPSSINCMKASIERYLKDHEYGYSLRDKEFNLSNQVLSAKKVELKKQGKGQKPNASRAVTKNEEKIMWENCQLGDSSPRVLLFSIWYYFTKCFGLRGRQEHRQLKFGDVELKKDAVSGREYLEFTERETKTRDGTGKENIRSVKPRLYATGSDRDPVQLYKTYLDRRPEKSKETECPFYLTCKPAQRIDSQIWYYETPMGENYLSKLVKMAAEECGFERKTNHSVRKSCVQTLRKAGVARDKIKHVTGHKSTHSIESYDDKLSDDEQMTFSDILTGVNNNQSENNVESAESADTFSAKSIVPAMVHEKSMNVPNHSMSKATSGFDTGSFFNMFGCGTVLNNCTFNINMNMAQSVSKSCSRIEPPKKRFRRIIYSESSESSQE